MQFDYYSKLNFIYVLNKLFGEISVEKPGKLSSLSTVPPVCPSPLPDILATGIPKAATIGLSTREVLSPTPPVLCLSTLTPWTFDKSVSPC